MHRVVPIKRAGRSGKTCAVAVLHIEEGSIGWKRMQVGNRVGHRKITFSKLRSKIMPLINVKLIEGVFTPAQKKEMITGLTDAMVSIEGESMRPVTVVIIEEVRSGEWGFGGQAMTTQAVQEMAAR